MSITPRNSSKRSPFSFLAGIPPGLHVEMMERKAKWSVA